MRLLPEGLLCGYNVYIIQHLRGFVKIQTLSDHRRANK